MAVDEVEVEDLGWEKDTFFLLSCPDGEEVYVGFEDLYEVFR